MARLLPIGVLHDSVSDNTGDRAIGMVMQQLLTSWKIAHEVVDPFAIHPERYSRLIIGGGELLGPDGEDFYDAFRIRGPHLLNAVGLRNANNLDYLHDYCYVSVRSFADRHTIKQECPDIDVMVVPCISMLMPRVSPPPDVDVAGAIGVHVHHGIAMDLEAVASTLRRHTRSLKIVLIPFTHYAGDLLVLNALSELIPNSYVAPVLSPDLLFAMMGKLRCMITVSLHATIFAYTQNVPVLAFPQADKVTHFLEDRALGEALIHTRQEFENKLERLLDDPSDYSSIIARDRSVLDQHINRLREILDEPPLAVERPTSISVSTPTITARWRREHLEQRHAALREISAHVSERLTVVSYLGKVEQALADEQRANATARAYVQQMEQALADEQRANATARAYVQQMEQALADEQRANATARAYVQQMEQEMANQGAHIVALEQYVGHLERELRQKAAYVEKLEQQVHGI